MPADKRLRTDDGENLQDLCKQTHRFGLRASGDSSSNPAAPLMAQHHKLMRLHDLRQVNVIRGKRHTSQRAILGYSFCIPELAKLHIERLETSILFHLNGIRHWKCRPTAYADMSNSTIYLLPSDRSVLGVSQKTGLLIRRDYAFLARGFPREWAPQAFPAMG